ncbi:MAG: phosphatase PAP2 family protein [Polyangiaceae bacterium]
MRKNLMEQSSSPGKSGTRRIIASLGVLLAVISPARLAVAQVPTNEEPVPPTAPTLAPTQAPLVTLPNAEPKPAAPEPIAPTRTIPIPGPTVPFPLPRTRGGETLHWNPQWRRSDGWDYTLTAVAGASTLFTAIVKPLPPSIHGPILFDESARKLRFDTFNQRMTARDLSDVLLSLSMTGPFLIDAMVVAWWYRGNKEVAKEIALIDLETLAVVGAVQGLTSALTGRERPYVQTCGKGLPADSLDCQTFGQNRSFFSGHTSLSFASASLVCTHHMNLDLFSGPTDELACISSYAAAATTGMLRIASDQHYASDVITGALIGTGIGLGLPYLLHYRKRATPERESSFHIQLVPTVTGGAAVGTF